MQGCPTGLCCPVGAGSVSTRRHTVILVAGALELAPPIHFSTSFPLLLHPLLLQTCPACCLGAPFPNENSSCRVGEEGGRRRRCLLSAVRLGQCQVLGEQRGTFLTDVTLLLKPERQEVCSVPATGPDTIPGEKPFVSLTLTFSKFTFA